MTNQLLAELEMANKEIERLNNYIHERDILNQRLEKDYKNVIKIGRYYKSQIKRIRELIHFNHKHFGIDEKDYISVDDILYIIGKDWNE